MGSYALFRLPYSQQYTMVEQNAPAPLCFTDFHQLNGLSGFVVAPFSTVSDPIVLIRPDRVTVGPLRASEAVLTPPAPADVNARSSYARSFDTFHSQLMAGNFRKLVLARCAVEPMADTTQCMELFFRACQLYPRLFVALVSTPVSGTWLTATPEMLVACDGRLWRTVALAGTMKLSGSDLQGEGEDVCWSVKNIGEQRMVATYMAERLKRFADDVTEEGPRTVRAANLVHLRSDFTFIYNGTRVGELLNALHPTPAVCGLPKEQAMRFILDNEPGARSYYSGFMGPLALGSGSSTALPVTQLYVTLRCMQVLTHSCRLFAGGGLLRESTEPQEWAETEAKLETMRQLIHSSDVL